MGARYPRNAALRRYLVFLCKPCATIFGGPAQAGYGDKWPS